MMECSIICFGFFHKSLAIIELVGKKVFNTPSVRIVVDSENCKQNWSHLRHSEHVISMSLQMYCMEMMF